MKRVILFILLLVGGVIGLTPPAVAHERHESSYKHAEVSIQANLNTTQDAIQVQASYSVGSHRNVRHKGITAAEVFVNNAMRQVRTFEPSAKGNVAFSLPLNTIPDNQRVKPLEIRVKIYTRYKQKRAPHNKPVAQSNVVFLRVPSISEGIQWTPNPLQAQVMIGSETQVSATVKSKTALAKATLSFTPEVSGLFTPPLTNVGDIPANTDMHLPLTITIPANKPAGVYKGNLKLRADGGVESALPVIVTVIAPDAQNIPQQVADPSAGQLVTQNGITQVKDEVDVGFALDAVNPDQQVRDIAAANHGVILGSIPGMNVYQLRFKVSNLSQLETIRAHIASLPGIKYASGNYLATDFAIPNDPLYPPASWLGAAKETDPNWGLKYINAPAAWDITTGVKSNTGIGIIDEGFVSVHEDLRNNVLPTVGFVKNGQISDGGSPSFHGNHVAGIACADGNNGVGVVGINWDCWLGLYHNTFNDMEVAATMKQAATDNMRVVNMSFGWSTRGNKCDVTQAELDSDLKGVVTSVNSNLSQAIDWTKGNGKDVLWVFAAGNGCRDAKYVAPASLAQVYPENTMTVAAIGKDGKKQSQSNVGSAISVAAPGEEILSTTGYKSTSPFYCRTSLIFSCGWQYDELTGTSMAAPYVTGLAGLVRAAHPDFPATKIKQCIVEGATIPVGGYPFKVIDAANAVGCQPPNNEPCIFNSDTHICASTDPLVALQARYSGTTGDCEFNVHAVWGDGVAEDFPIKGQTPGSFFTYATHQYAKPGVYKIDLTGTVTGGGLFCSINNASFTFTLQPQSKP